MSNPALETEELGYLSISHRLKVALGVGVGRHYFSGTSSLCLMQAELTPRRALRHRLGGFGIWKLDQQAQVPEIQGWGPDSTDGIQAM